MLNETHVLLVVIGGQKQYMKTDQNNAMTPVTHNGVNLNSRPKNKAMEDDAMHA